MLLGKEAVETLLQKRVAVFGIGGVGGFTVEALARSGVGALDLIDRDTVEITNLNRQLIATYSALGRLKTEVMAERIRDIHPECKVEEHPFFFLPETADRIDFAAYDYIVDCVDTVTAKLSIIERAKEAGIPVISAMGAGNKLDPTAFLVADIADTSVCPLAKVMRRELKKRGITDVKCVYSTEETVKPIQKAEGTGRTPGSVSFVPSVMGLIIAGEVIKDLIK